MVSSTSAAAAPPCLVAAGPRPGYAWVDARGRTLLRGPPAHAPAATAPAATAPATTAATAATTATGALAALTPAERSMRIWRRVSPGMMPGTSATPESTSRAAFKHEAALLPRMDWTHHLKKTDFSAYVEARERQHVGLKTKS